MSSGNRIRGFLTFLMILVGIVIASILVFIIYISHLHNQNRQECIQECSKRSQKWELTKDGTCLCYGELTCVKWE